MRAAHHHKPKAPSVSVVMTTYNRASLLQQAITSIQRQTLQDWELVIVDDASHDNTPQLLERLEKQDGRLRVYRHKENKGPATARNTGVRHAQGRYIALHDDDDISLSQRLQTQADVLDAQPHIDMVVPALQCMTRDTPISTILKTDFVSSPTSPPSLVTLADMPFPFPALMGRQELFHKIPMRPFFAFAEDYDFVLRCIRYYHIETIDDVLYYYRIADDKRHTMSTSSHTLYQQWIYQYLSWASACHHHYGWEDPIDHSKTIEEARQKIHPQFAHKAQQGIKKLVKGFLHNMIKRQTPQEFRHNLTKVLHVIQDKKYFFSISHKIIFQCLLKGHRLHLSSFLHFLLLTNKAHDTSRLS